MGLNLGRDFNCCLEIHDVFRQNYATFKYATILGNIHFPSNTLFENISENPIRVKFDLKLKINCIVEILPTCVHVISKNLSTFRYILGIPPKHSIITTKSFPNKLTNELLISCAV